MLEDDYYDILNVPHDATIEVVRKSYKKLALDAHPDKNRGNPSATAKFQRLHAAYEVIMDSVKRLEYDLKWPNIRAARDAEQERKKREQEAARAKEDQRREEADRQKQENQKRKAEDEELKRNQDIRLQKALANFRHEADQLQSEIFERNRIIRRLSIGIKELDNRDKQASQSPEYGSGWHTSAHLGYSKNEVERARDAEHHQRQASRRIKESHLLQEKDKLKVDEMRLTCTIHCIEIGKYLINGCRIASSGAREFFIAEAEWNLMMARSSLARQLRELEDEKEEERKRKVELERAAAKREELRIEREEMAKRKRKRASDEQEDEAQKKPRIVKDFQHSFQSYRRNPSSRRIRRGFERRFN